MNWEQFQYALGRVNERADIAVSSYAAFFGTSSVYYGLDGNSRIDRIKAGVLGVLFAASLFLRFKLHSKKKSNKPDPNIEKLDFVDKVLIEDRKSLELLLEKTQEASKLEWGTLLRAHEEDRIAHITEILDFDKVVKDGIVTKCKRRDLYFDVRKIIEGDYGGIHHFHPHLPIINSGFNFAISYVDRYFCCDAINLLSFNRPCGPEVIAFNYNNTFIPEDETKTRLIKATPQDIWKYLAKK